MSAQRSETPLPATDVAPFAVGDRVKWKQWRNGEHPPLFVIGVFRHAGRWRAHVLHALGGTLEGPADMFERASS